jgi:hypothetical protein
MGSRNYVRQHGSAMPKVQIYQQPVKGLEGLGNTFRALKILDSGFGANEKSIMSSSDKN